MPSPQKVNLARPKNRLVLEGLGDAVEDALRKELKTATSLEARKRLGRLVKLLDNPGQSPVYLQNLRGVEVLEHIETAKAKRLLEQLAKGMASAHLTTEARNTLRRLRHRSDLQKKSR